jgi:hypothetical protein
MAVFGRSDRLHPLGHPHLLTDRGVTRRPGPDLTGDHLARVQADPQLQFDTVAVLDLNRELCSFVLDGQGRQAGANSVILQRDWCNAVASALITSSAAAAFSCSRSIRLATPAATPPSGGLAIISAWRSAIASMALHHRPRISGTLVAAQVRSRLTAPLPAIAGLSLA